MCQVYKDNGTTESSGEKFTTLTVGKILTQNLVVIIMYLPDHIFLCGNHKKNYELKREFWLTRLTCKQLYSLKNVLFMPLLVYHF